MDWLPHSVTFNLKGEKPHIKSWKQGIAFVPNCLFNIDKIEATDSLGGEATKVGIIHVGTDVQCKPIWDTELYRRLESGVLASDFGLKTL